MGKVIQAQERFQADDLSELQEAAAVEMEEAIAWLGQVTPLLMRESDRAEAEERLQGLVFVRSVYPPQGRVYVRLGPDKGA